MLADPSAHGPVPWGRRASNVQPRGWHRSALALAATLCLSAVTAPAAAATVFWVGSGPGNNWNSWDTNIVSPTFGATNWYGTNVIASNGDSLIFDGNRRLVSNNTHLSSIASLHFAEGAGAFTLRGNGLTVNGVISNYSGNAQTIDLPITVGASNQTWSGGAQGILLKGGFDLDNKSLSLGHNVAIDSAGTPFVYGSAEIAMLVVNVGSTLSTGRASLGSGSGNTGRVTVTGRRALWLTNESLYLGVRGGRGELIVRAGGSVRTVGDAWVGYDADPGGSLGSGWVMVKDENSSWKIDGQLVLGAFPGSYGRVFIEPGGLVTAASLSVAPGSLVGLNGGRLGLGPGAAQTVVDALEGLDWVRGTVSFTNALGLGTALTLGVGRRLEVANTLTIGTGHALTLRGGELKVGALTLSGGVIDSAHGVDLGNLVGQTGGGMVSGAVSGELGQDVPLRWTSGTLKYLNDVSLGPTLTLSQGRTLEVGNRLTIGAGRTLVLDGGQLKSGAVTLSGGSIQSSGRIDIGDTGSLTGYGGVSGSVHGGAGKTITASGGTLSLGAGNKDGAFDFAGTLNVGTQWVRLLSANAAQLGAATTLGAGGRLTTLNGASLGSGESLSFTGDASIEGHFSHDGTISGSGGALSFANGVSGAGSFAGNIVFKGAHSPGNRVAAVSFGGGKGFYEPGSVLTMEILGSAPGQQYDQLLDLGLLSFDGTLNLVFGAGFTPADGQQFALFDFAQFRGSFVSERIQVSGIDRGRLDFSQLATSGTLAISSPVPEPGPSAMLVAGLGAMGWLLRRRRGGIANGAACQTAAR